MSETIAHDAINDERDTEITRLTAEFEKKDGYIDDLEGTIDSLRDDLEAMTSRYIRSIRVDDQVEALEKKNAALREVVDELADQQCPECGRDSMERQFVCEHCGHRAAIDDAEEK